MTERKTVDALQGAFPWVGGKRILARTIGPTIEAVPRTCYAEPFVGAGGIVLRRRSRPTGEAVNDKSREVSTFFRVLRRHPDALIAELQWRLASRDEFNRLRAAAPDTMTDIERAARPVYPQHCAYGGKPEAAVAIGPLTRSRFNAPRVARLLRRIHRRLAAVYIDRLDFEAFITRWDRPTTPFHLDPPCRGCEDCYGKRLFERADFERLAEALKGLQGRFPMSLNDAPEVRRIFAGFAIRPVETVYRLAGRKAVTEPIVTG